MAVIHSTPLPSITFNTAPLYQMFVGAGKPGFVTRLYFLERRKPGSDSWLMRNPIRAAGKLVTLTPGSKLNGLDFFLRPKPEIAQMPDAPLTQAHSAVRQHLRFVDGQFSPDGSQFVFGVNTSPNGGPEETWSYDLRNQQLRQVANRPGPLAQTHQNSVAHAGEYVVSADFQGSGHLRLLALSTRLPKERVIAKGSWELENFLVNPARSQVLYPGSPGYSKFSSAPIVTYDLRTGRSQSKPLDFHSGRDRLLDVTSDGKLLAYSVAGPCNLNDFTNPFLAHNEQSTKLPPANVCFLRMK